MIYWGFDWTYLVMVLPFVILSIVAQAKVKSAYSKYASIANSRGMTGAEAALMVLSANGVSPIPVNMIKGELSDNYDPRTNTINLSEGVYSSRSIAALGIACHEAGHAVQYAVGYYPVRLRMTMLPVCNFSSQFAFIAIILGMIFSISVLAWVGVGLFAIASLFQLVTLPVEFNASSRAMNYISGGGFSQDDIKGAKSVLTAAAMTYVAAFATSVATLLRLIFIVSGRRRN